MKIACTRCGADISYIPGTNSVKCEYCGSVIDVSEFKTIDFEEKSKFSDYDTYKCTSCGAELLTDTETSITRCAYCGSQQFIKDKFRGEFKPEVVIPFKLDNRKFVDVYQRFIHKRILAPEEFRNNQYISDIKGVYVPYYLYDCDVHVASRGRGTKRDSKNNTINRYFDIKYNFSCRVPQDGSKRIEDDVTSSLEPFNYKELKSFNPIYLSGFSAETTTETNADLDKKIENRMNFQISNLASKEANDGFQHVQGIEQIQYNVKKRTYGLLPVWFFNTRYNNKFYPCAVNAQTGKVVGEIPLSKPKFTAVMTAVITIAVILIIAIVTADISSSRYSSDDDDDDSTGTIVCGIIGGVIAIYGSIKAKYRNKNRPEDNVVPRENLRILQKVAFPSGKKYFAQYPNDELERLEIKSKLSYVDEKENNTITGYENNQNHAYNSNDLYAFNNTKNTGMINSNVSDRNVSQNNNIINRSVGTTNNEIYGAVSNNSNRVANNTNGIRNNPSNSNSNSLYTNWNS